GAGTYGGLATHRTEECLQRRSPGTSARMVRLALPPQGRRSLDHGRKGVCLSDPTVQVDGIPTSVFLDRLGVLMDRVGSQVLQFRATGVQHRDPSAATTVGCVGAFRIAWIHASFLAQ